MKGAVLPAAANGSGVRALTFPSAQMQKAGNGLSQGVL